MADQALDLLSAYPEAEAAWMYETWGLIGISAYALGNYAEAKDALEQALRHQNSIPSKDVALTRLEPARLMSRLAKVHEDRGQWDRTMQWLSRPGLEEALADFYLDQGRVAEAGEVIEKLQKNNPSKFIPEDGEAYYSRARWHLAQGRLGKAENQLRRVLTSREDSAVWNSAQVAEPAIALAQLNRYKENFQTAIEYGEKALALQKAYYAPNHPRLIPVYDELARAYLSQGRLDEARQVIETALQITASCPDLDTRRYRPRALISHAKVLRGEGKKQRAREVLNDALRSTETLSTDPLPEDIELLETQADWSEADEDALIAEDYYRNALKSHEALMGVQHPGRLKLLESLAKHYQKRGKHDQARALAAEAQALWVRYAGAGHSKASGLILGTRRAAGTDQYSEQSPAMSRYHEVLELAAKSLDGRLTGNKAAKGSPVAEALFQRALEIYERMLGPDDPELIIVLDNYAEFLRQQGRESEAEELESRARQIRGY